MYDFDDGEVILQTIKPDIAHITSCRNVISIEHRTTVTAVFKLLLDEVFVISRIIKVEVRVISRSRRLRLITLTETLIILDITKTECNNCFIIH